MLAWAVLFLLVPTCHSGCFPSEFKGEILVLFAPVPGFLFCFPITPINQFLIILGRCTLYTPVCLQDEPTCMRIEPV